MEASRNIFFSHLLTISTLSKTNKGADLGFFPKKRENYVFFSTGTGIADALCKKQEGAVPYRSRKKVTEMTQAMLSGRLKGKVKFSWRLISNVIFPGGTECPPKYEYIRR